MLPTRGQGEGIPGEIGTLPVFPNQQRPASCGPLQFHGGNLGSSMISQFSNRGGERNRSVDHGSFRGMASIRDMCLRSN